MPFPWEKVIPNKPQVLEAARGFYEKWMTRTEKTSANDAADSPTHAGRPISSTEIIDVTEIRDHEAEVFNRLEALEFAGMALAETVKSSAQQSEMLSHGLSELQTQIHDLDQSVRRLRQEGETNRVTLESINTQIEKLSANSSRVSRRATMALWFSTGAIVAAAIAIVVVI